jgi:hypothetical protein
VKKRTERQNNINIITQWRQPRFLGLQKKEFNFHLLEAVMGTKGYSAIPSTLLEGSTFFARVLPVRSVPNFIELLVGVMLTQTSSVTEAWLPINPLRTWTACYKWLQQGKWSWVALGVQLARWIVARFPQSTQSTAIRRNPVQGNHVGIDWL